MISFRDTIIMILFLGTVGCAHSRTCPHHSAPGSPVDIMTQASDAFSNAPGLQEDQKKRLTDIYRQTMSDAMTIRREIFEKKTLLFRAVARSSVTSAEIENLKSQIVELDQKRLRLMFKALADVQAVIGTGADKEEIYQHLRDYEMPRTGNLASGPG